MHWSMVAIALLFCSAAQAYDWTIAPEDIESLTKAEAQSLVSKRKGRLILSGLTSVSPEVAKVLAQYKGSLELDSLTTISPKVAEALATHRGDGLSLDGLTDISGKVASALAQHDGGLSLGGLSTLSPDVADALATLKTQATPVNYLGLSGLTSISPSIAKSLAAYEGSLHLNGLTTISPEVAEALANHKGTLFLGGLTTISTEVAEVLVRHNGNVSLGSKMGDPGTAHYSRLKDSRDAWAREVAQATARQAARRQARESNPVESPAGQDARVADVRNASWGDSSEAVKQTASEQLAEEGAASDSVPSGPKRRRTLIGDIKVAEELYQIRYEFFDNQLVEVGISASYTEKDNAVENKYRDHRWNPFKSRSTLGRLLATKYGDSSSIETINDQRSVGRIERLEWNDNRPIRSASVFETWNLNRQDIRLSAVQYKSDETLFRLVHIKYEAKGPTAESYRQYCKEQDAKKDLELEQREASEAKGL